MLFSGFDVVYKKVGKDRARNRVRDEVAAREYLVRELAGVVGPLFELAEVLAKLVVENIVCFLLKRNFFFVACLAGSKLFLTHRRAREHTGLKVVPGPSRQKDAHNSSLRKEFSHGTCALDFEFPEYVFPGLKGAYKILFGRSVPCTVVDSYPFQKVTVLHGTIKFFFGRKVIYLALTLAWPYRASCPRNWIHKLRKSLSRVAYKSSFSASWETDNEYQRPHASTHAVRAARQLFARGPRLPRRR